NAWQDLLACHRLGRHVAHGGTLIEALVGLAINQIASNADLAYLENAKLTVEQIRKRIADLQNLPPIPPMADKIDLAERFMYLDTWQMTRGGGGEIITLSDGPGKPLTEEEKKALEAIDWVPALKAGNRAYDRMAAALRRQDRAKRVRELDG